MKKEAGILLALGASAVVIIFVTVMTILAGNENAKPKKKKPITPTVAAVQQIKRSEGEVGIIKYVDLEGETIRLYTTGEEAEKTIAYRTGADIKDKYGTMTYAAALRFGDVVRYEADAGGNLLWLQKSSSHWELHGIEEFTIGGGVLTVNGVNYKITDRTIAYCENEPIDIGEVKEIDRINLCGIGSDVLSICVVKGHGSIRLIHTEQFQGAKVSFGDESHTLEGEPSYLVREGDYKVVVTGEKDAALVELTVKRNVQQVVDLYEYGGKPVQNATVRFHVTPYSTKLKVDGETVDYYEKDLILAYGEHTLEASLDGYHSFKGKAMISKDYQSFSIDLTENGASSYPGGQRPDGDGQGGDDPGGDSQGGDNPGGDSRGGDNPGGDDPGGDNQGGDNPGGKEPAGQTDDQTRDVFWISDALVETMDYEQVAGQYTYIREPENAEIKIEGISIGKTPLRFGKLLGTYTITLEKDGKTEDFTVTVEDDGKDKIWELAFAEESEE